MRRRLLRVVVAVSLAWAVGALGQTPKKGKASLTGVMIGHDGNPVEHAAVVCQSSSGSSPRVVYTDENGRFAIKGLRQDNYDLRATANGFYSNWLKNIVVRNGQIREVTVRLVNKDVASDGGGRPNQKP